MDRKIKFRALKENPKEYVGSYGKDNYDNAKWVYGSGIVPVYINTYLNTHKLEMVVDVNYDELDYWQPSYSNCAIIPNTICQYTEVDDKNGKNIFHKDIVSAPFIGYGGKKQKRIGVVEYVKGAFCVNWNDSEEYGKNFLGYVNDIEVIGNIFDNPELIQEETENAHPAN